MGDTDPYLAYRPSISYSLPIQLLVNGITITLLAVLLMHLLFTVQYHYPLAPLNYSLQLSSVIVVFISVVIKIAVILEQSVKSVETWPYGLDYIAVSIPPSNWSMAQSAAWFFLQALNNGLSNITHIQFLTLLYPSRVEARLIIFVLAPLAIASSGLVFTALSARQKVLDISDSIRNVLNSTLLLIFTLALVIWGFFVNRRRAWRTDGGTAVFGFGAMFLAVISTTFNFVAVAEDGIDWLQHLLFAAILWQTWLGWWWWVGSGMGIGEVEDLMERAERKKRKSARRAARQRQLERQTQRTGSSLAGIVDAGHASATAMMGFTTSVAGILRQRSSTMIRRSTQSPVNRAGDEEEGMAAGSASALSGAGHNRLQPPAASGGPPSPSPGNRVEFDTPSGSRNGTGPQHSTNSETSSTSATPSLHSPQTIGQILAYPTTWLQVYLRRLRRAHEDAAEKAALRRVERRQQVFESRREREREREREEERSRPAALSSGDEEIPMTDQRPARPEVYIVDDEGVGWGLGSFGIKEHRESARRLQVARERLQGERLLGIREEREPTSSLAGPSRSSRLEALAGTSDGQRSASPSFQISQTSRIPRTSANLGSDEEVGEGEEREEAEGRGNDGEEGGGRSGRQLQEGRPGSVRGRTQPQPARESEGEWEDLEDTNTSSSSGARDRRRGRRRGRNGDGDGGGGGGAGRDGGRGRKGTGWSWWGPLKDWRRSDRSVF